MPSFRKIGEWERVGRLVRDMGPNMALARKRSLMRFGLKAEKIAKEHISSQDLGWAPLSPRYLFKKVSAGHSHLILIATSSYFQSITSWVETDTALIGVKKGVLAADGRNSQGDIAFDLEFGVPEMNLPARPLWKPTFDETLRWHYEKNTPTMHLADILSKY